jgi:2-polyprenyl-6-methoxyphenol hydroxylase-like FAD-dependent oxidoreductase
MKAIVIGAGIGGLSAAIALRKAGVETVVFERARELKDIGGLSAAIALVGNPAGPGLQFGAPAL